jgi:anaerobic selenocysteine-containing dehydrogenase
MNALHDTKSPADVILTIAARLGGRVADALPWVDSAAFLEDISAELLGSSISAFDATTRAEFWSRWRQFGGWWSQDRIREEPELTRALSDPLDVSAPAFLGDPASYPYHLVPYESLTLTDGRGAHLPWLQEVPHPMTTARWNSWVEIHPQAAARLGVKDNEVVRVVSPTRSLELPVVVYPGMLPDVVAIPTGQGHEASGRFASKRGGNVFQLIPAPNVDTGYFLWRTTRVRLEPVGRTQAIARLENLEGRGRERIR